MADLLGTYLNLGSTNKFFMPWLVPRNQKDTVYQATWLSRFFGKRRRRDVRNLASDTEIEGMALW